MKVSNKSLHMKIRFCLNMYVLSSEKKIKSKYMSTNGITIYAAIIYISVYNM